MLRFFHLPLIVLAALAPITDVQAAGKGRGPATHHARPAPRHVSHTKVTHYRRPAVHRHPVQRVRRSATRVVRQPVRRTTVRSVHRYPVHRVQRRFVRRPYYSHRNLGVRRYTYSYYPSRYLWRRSHYNRGYGMGRRHGSRAIGGIVESVQGNPINGTVLVKTLRPRSSRFRYTAARARAGWGATSLHRFHVNNGTRYQVMSVPPRGGTFADLHKGERVLIRPHANSGQTAQIVHVYRQRRR
jgi:hypothetical protein